MLVGVVDEAADFLARVDELLDSIQGSNSDKTLYMSADNRLRLIASARYVYRGPWCPTKSDYVVQPVERYRDAKVMVIDSTEDSIYCVSMFSEASA